MSADNRTDTLRIILRIIENDIERRIVNNEWPVPLNTADAILAASWIKGRIAQLEAEDDIAKMGGGS